jgi:hypothetical protein
MTVYQAPPSRTEDETECWIVAPLGSDIGQVFLDKDIAEGGARMLTER